jgi:alpha,alpha-trehalase
MYPWQSGSSGREESQTIHLNPRSRRWVPDNSSLQRHINSAVAYNLWQYYQVTQDTEFLHFRGAEMLVEIARFWASIASYNAGLDRYEIHGVMGPDEYHDGYPDVEQPGLSNSAYTNVMAVWVLCRALEVLELLPAERRQALRENLRLGDEEIDLWGEISRKMKVVFHEDGIISQFEGYDRLREFDWEGYRQKYGDVQRLDRILEAEGDSPNRYKASKQADVLMLFYLLSADELRELFERLGYPFEYETIPKNVSYYVQRTSHGSTLSRVVHSWVLARSDRARSWSLFKQALESDIADIQNGTTPEGIHLGAMAGTADVVQRGYTGIEVRGDALWLNPRLPDDLGVLFMRLRYRKHWLEVEIAGDRLKVSTTGEAPEPMSLGVIGEVYELQPGDSREFRL